MRGEEAFEAAVEDAKRLEKRIVEYSPYKGDVDLHETMELEPEEFEDLDYLDVRNLYERSQKILSAKEMAIYAEAPKEEMKPSAETEEVESRLREMTSETLKTAEEVRKEPVTAPKAPEKEPSIIEMVEVEAGKPPEIELEKPPKKVEIEKPPEIELERPAAPGIELEKPAEAKPAKPEAPEMEEAPKRPPAIPPALRESPDEAASRKYQKMEEQIRSMIGEKADELTLKKKMLELTKQLFKEKSVNKREEIKLQITVLKNMLVTTKEGVKPKGRKKKDETHAKLYDTLLSTQQADIARTKDEIIGKYAKRVESIKKKFYEDISAAEEPAKRKQIYEAFVFSVTSLVEQLPAALAEYRDFTMKKHTAEMEKLKGSLDAQDKDVAKNVDERLGYIKDSYDAEFSAVRGIIGREIDNLIEVTGGEVFEEAKELPEAEETKAHEIVKEIDDTDEGTLLYHLHSTDPDYYKRYERKQISKAEAIFRAKALMAKEKGLSKSMVKKYFTQTED